MIAIHDPAPLTDRMRPRADAAARPRTKLARPGNSMPLLRRHVLSLLASTSTTAMRAANAQALPAARPRGAGSRQAAVYPVNPRRFTAGWLTEAA